MRHEGHHVKRRGAEEDHLGLVEEGEDQHAHRHGNWEAEPRKRGSGRGKPVAPSRKKRRYKKYRDLVFVVVFISLGALLPSITSSLSRSLFGRAEAPEDKAEAPSVEVPEAPKATLAPAKSLTVQAALERGERSVFASNYTYKPPPRMLKVADTVVKGLEEREKKVRAGDKGQVNDWWSTHNPLHLIHDIKQGRTYFLTTARAQSCFDACAGVGLACQRHWFDVLNYCQVLREAFPEAKDCSGLFYGRDLPAYREEDQTVLINKLPRTWAASCGGKHEKTRRLCGCAVRKGGASARRTFHTVYNVQPSKYFEWQVRYMHLWFRQAAMPGSITRLLSAKGPDHLVSEVPTHVAPPLVRKEDPGYTPYNKPSAVDHWLRHTRPKEDIVMIVDPDCMIVHKFDAEVEEGSPIAQQAFYYFDFDKDEEPMQIARRYCQGCTFLDPIAVPIIIHRNDLAKIAPLWLSKTEEIRDDIKNWPSSWTNRSKSSVGLQWTAEMFGYVFAASELGIRHDIWDLQVVPGVHRTLITPIIHYHVEVRLPNGRAWYKHTDDAGYNIPWPLPPETDEVTSIFITKMHEAYTTLNSTGFDFKGSRYDPNFRR